jgi:two-component system, OmpR family, alkaline phosphatase synthesis response regulator PhoP
MRVLVIDDEPDVLMLCRMNLEFAGHEVLEASSGEAGLEIALAERPDVVVLDVMLPTRDGLAVLSDLSSEASTRNVPVILLTAKNHADDKRAGWRAGCTEYVTKPFSPIELVGLVDRTHRMSRRERSARRKQALNSLRD